MAYSYFAFLDVMGYRYHLSKDTTAGTENFREKLISSYRAFETIEINTLHHKSISDSIFMSSSNNPVDFLLATKKIFLSFLDNGLFVRGGIAYNKHFETNHITYSHALTDAYAIESTQAIFPRILIHKSVIEKLKNESLPPINSASYNSIITNELLLECGSHYQLHIIDSENWINTYNRANEIFESSQQDINESPKLISYHYWFQEYLFSFKPSNNRKKRYISQFQKLTNRSAS